MLSSLNTIFYILISERIFIFSYSCNLGNSIVQSPNLYSVRVTVGITDAATGSLYTSRNQTYLAIPLDPLDTALGTLLPPRGPPRPVTGGPLQTRYRVSVRKPQGSHTGNAAIILAARFHLSCQ